jgi:serine/threonine-protein kinase
MGVVYSAFQNNLQRTVAVKLLLPAFVAQEDYNERFTREARTAASLEHAHIVPVYDYGTQGDLSYVVMRLLTGGTLMERIRQRAGVLPSLGEVATLLNQVADALEYAHSQGIVHRDIKASNIMFDAQGRALLVDFGIAKLLDETTMTNSGLAVGTPTHMSPEQWRGQAVTPASDQYALAVVIFEAAAGKLPFETTSAYALLNMHLNEMPTPLKSLRPDTPREVTAVLDRALAKEPKDRYPSVKEFAAAFEQAVRGRRGKPPACSHISCGLKRR